MITGRKKNHDHYTNPTKRDGEDQDKDQSINKIICYRDVKATCYKEVKEKETMRRQMVNSKKEKP